MTAEEELKERRKLFGRSSILDKPALCDGFDHLQSSRNLTVWASLAPEDIDLIVNLVVARIMKRMEK